MEKDELIKGMAQLLDSKLLPMLRKIDRVENKMERLDKKLDRVEFRLESVETNVVDINTRLESVETNVVDINARLESVETTVNDIDIRVKNVEMVIENDVKRGLELISEGHTPLFEKYMTLDATVSDLNEKVRVLWPATKSNFSELTELKTLKK